MADLSPRCIGVASSSSQAFIRTRGNAAVWFPQDFFTYFLLGASAIELFWYVNVNDSSLVGDTILNVRRSDNGLNLHRLWFQAHNGLSVTLRWEFYDRAGITNHIIDVAIPVAAPAVFAGVWWHSILQMWPPQGQGASQWTAYHGRTAVTTQNTQNATFDTMPYPINNTSPLGSIQTSTNHAYWLMGYRYGSSGSVVEYRICLGAQLNTTATGVVGATQLNGGFAEMRLWQIGYDPNPIPGNPPTPSEWQRRRNLYLRHSANPNASGEGVASEINDNLRHCFRFNEPAGTAAASYVDVGQNNAIFDASGGGSNFVQNGGFLTSPIQTPAGGSAVSLIPNNAGSASFSTDPLVGLRRTKTLVIVPDLALSTDPTFTLRKANRLQVVADAAQSADPAVPLPRTRRLAVVADLSSATEAAISSRVAKIQSPNADLAAASEAGLDFARAQFLDALDDAAASSELALDLHKAGFVILNPTADLASSSEAGLDFSRAQQLDPVVDDAVSSEPGAPPAGPGIAISQEEILQLPTSGGPWDNLFDIASQPFQVNGPRLYDQDSPDNIRVLARALVWARTGNTTMRDEAKTALLTGIQTTTKTSEGVPASDILGLLRNTAAYVIAADILDNSGALSGAEKANLVAFFTTLRDAVQTNTSSQFNTIKKAHTDRPNNFGHHAGASRMAIDLFIGDTADFSTGPVTGSGTPSSTGPAVEVAKRTFGDDTAAYNYDEFDWGGSTGAEDFSWQAEPYPNYFSINRQGSTLGTTPPRNADGAQPEEMRRWGPFVDGMSWPPAGIASVTYPLEGLQGLLLQVLILEKQGIAAKSWSDQALLRAFDYVWTELQIPIDGVGNTQDDTYQTYAINHLYGTSYTTVPMTSINQQGKNFGFTDWLFSGGAVSEVDLSIDRQLVPPANQSLSSETVAEINVAVSDFLVPTPDMATSGEAALTLRLSARLQGTDSAASSEGTTDLVLSARLAPQADLAQSSEDGVDTVVSGEVPLVPTTDDALSSEAAVSFAVSRPLVPQADLASSADVAPELRIAKPLEPLADTSLASEATVDFALHGEVPLIPQADLSTSSETAQLTRTIRSMIPVASLSQSAQNSPRLRVAHRMVPNADQSLSSQAPLDLNHSASNFLVGTPDLASSSEAALSLRVDRQLVPVPDLAQSLEGSASSDEFTQNLQSLLPNHYWKLNEAFPTFAIDSGTDGTGGGVYLGTPIVGSQGLVSDLETSVYFDTFLDRAESANTTSWQTTVDTHSFTIGARFQIDDFSGPTEQFVCAKTGYFDMAVLDDGSLRVRRTRAIGTLVTLSSSTGLIQPGIPYFVVVVFNRITGGGLSVYVNGVLVASDLDISAQNSAVVNQKWRVAVQSDVSGEVFNGRIQHVFMFKAVALTPTQVAFISDPHATGGTIPDMQIDRQMVGTADGSSSGDGAAGLSVDRRLLPPPDLSQSSDTAPFMGLGELTQFSGTIVEKEYAGSAALCSLEAYLSKLEIWNVALTALGLETLTQENDDVSQATALADNWNMFKGKFLRDRIWNGAKATAVLSLFMHGDGVTPVTPDGGRWTYAYLLPSTAGREWVRSVRLNGKENRPGDKARIPAFGLWEEEVVWNDAGTGRLCLLTNESAANLEYIFKVADNDIDLLLAEDMKWAMAMSLAEHMAADLGSSSVDIRELERKAEQARREAGRTDAQSGSKFTFTDTTIADAFG